MKHDETLPTMFQEEAQAILSIKNGADIYSYGLAQTLRGIQRRGVPVDEMKSVPHRMMEGSLFQITDLMMYTGSGADRMPYFGAIATKRGLKAARQSLRNIKALNASAKSASTLSTVEG